MEYIKKIIIAPAAKMRISSNGCFFKLFLLIQKADPPFFGEDRPSGCPAKRLSSDQFFVFEIDYIEYRKPILHLDTAYLAILHCPDKFDKLSFSLMKVHPHHFFRRRLRN